MKTAFLAEKNVGKIRKCLTCESLTVLKEIHSKFFSQRAPLHLNFFLTGHYIVRRSDWVFVGSLFLPTSVCWLVGRVVSKITQKLLDRFWLNFHQKVSCPSFQLISFWWPKVKFTQKSKSLLFENIEVEVQLLSLCGWQCWLLIINFWALKVKDHCLVKKLIFWLSLDWIDIES